MTRRTTTPRRRDRATVAAAAQAHAETQAAARGAREASRLPVGQPAYDTRRGRHGIVMDHLDGYVWLRPPAGGVEWTALPGDVEPVADGIADKSPDGTVFHARVAVANARSRGEVL